MKTSTKRINIPNQQKIWTQRTREVLEARPMIGMLFPKCAKPFEKIFQLVLAEVALVANRGWGGCGEVVVELSKDDSSTTATLVELATLATQVTIATKATQATTATAVTITTQAETPRRIPLISLAMLVLPLLIPRVQSYPLTVVQKE